MCNRTTPRRHSPPRSVGSSRSDRDVVRSPKIKLGMHGEGTVISESRQVREGALQAGSVPVPISPDGRPHKFLAGKELGVL